VRDSPCYLAVPMNRDLYKIKTGSRVAVVGGGPAGCFFAMYLMHFTRGYNIRPEITIYEPRDLDKPGPKGCKGCAGILSSSLLKSLAELGLDLPEEVIQQRIDGYTILSPYTSISMSNPEKDAQVVSVFRGCGPRSFQGEQPIGFDNWLLSETQKRGVNVDRRAVSRILAGRPMQLDVEGERWNYELIVLATGVNAKATVLEGLGYVPPRTQTMAQDELQVETIKANAHSSNVARAFLIPRSGLVFGALVPKGSFLNVSVLNKTEQPISVSDFLGNEIVGNALRGACARVCGCSPRIAITSGHNYYGDGFVAVGDAAVSRLYKDGIGSASRTAREAALTVARSGFSRRDFRRGYHPFCRRIDRDNRWGRWLFQINDRVKDSRTFLWMQHRLIGDEQIAAWGPKPFTKAVWGMFTGSYSYRSIARMTLGPASLSKLFVALLREVMKIPFHKSSGPRTLHIGARKVLILGSGFAGTYVLRNLVPSLNRNENVETTMVSDENFFLFSPLLHEVAMGRIETRHIAYPIRRLNWRDRFSFIQGSVQKIDLKERRVVTTAGTLEFDYLVMALGSVADLSELNAGSANAFALKSLHDSMVIRNHIIKVFEQALAEKDPEKRRQLLTFVVSGGGYKGLQLVTELRDFIHSTLLKLYRPIKPENVRLILVEAEPRVGAGLHARFGVYIMRQLERMGIEVRHASRVTRVWDDRVEINGTESVPAHTLLWVAGIAANPLIAELEIEKDGLGRILVDDFLNVPGFPGVYAAGDCACFIDPLSGQPIPPQAHTAVSQARAVARNILAEIRGRDAEPYRYQRNIQMVSLGASRAVVKLCNLRLYGFPARIVWLAAYTLLIAGAYNRIRVLMDWLLSMIFGRDTTFLKLTKS
jgi:NADH:ubiquinone reductase (H+-translocating)